MERKWKGEEQTHLIEREGETVRMATEEQAKALPTQPVPVPIVGTLNFGGGGGDAATGQGPEEVGTAHS